MENLLNIIEKINKNCNWKNILYYIKIHFIQAPLEAFLALFLFIWGMIISTPELLNDDKIIKISLTVGAITCIIFLVIINIAFLCCINHLINQEIENGNTMYAEAENQFLKLSYFIHGFGIFCYSVDVIIFLFAFHGKGAFEDMQNILLFIIGIGAGTIWNWRGYVGDRRIDWKQIFTALKDISYDEVFDYSRQGYHLRRTKLKYTILHIATNVITCIAVMLIYVALAFHSINDESLVDTFISLGGQKIGTYGFFVISFIIVFIYYVKTLYPLFYPAKTYIFCEYKKLFPKR